MNTHACLHFSLHVVMCMLRCGNMFPGGTHVAEYCSFMIDKTWGLGWTGLFR